MNVLATLARTRVRARFCEGEQRPVIYECENCGGFHSWNLDCRNDANRYASKDDYAHRNGLRISDIDARSMHERTAADS